MKRSRNEIEGMALKAARGAGVPLGHCEDFARAAGALAMVDVANLPCLSKALTGPFDVNVQEDPLRLTGATVLVLPMALDALRGGAGEVEIGVGHDPAVVQAYLDIAAQDFDLHVKYATEGKLHLSDMLQNALPTRQVEVPDPLWAELNTLAFKTYVPESEASRLAGAGAGLTDND